MAASCGDATTPEMPERLACSASTLTCSDMGRVTPVSARAAWLMEVSTVMPKVIGTSKPYSAAARSAPFCAALIMATPPMVCIVIMSAPLAAAEYAAPST